METFVEEMRPGTKLYVVTRRDLPAGAQAVQAGHAMVGYSFKDPERFKLWHTESDYLCYLSVEDEAALDELCNEADSRGLVFYEFREADFDDALTAVCFEPTLASRKLMSGLPLALREHNERSHHRRYSTGDRSGNGSSDGLSEVLPVQG